MDDFYAPYGDSHGSFNYKGREIVYSHGLYQDVRPKYLLAFQNMDTWIPFKHAETNTSMDIANIILVT